MRVRTEIIRQRENYGKEKPKRSLRKRAANASWYTEGDPCPNGIIQPGQTAVRDPSRQGSNDPTGGKSKWAYIAIDPGGLEYYAESVVELVPFTK